MKKRTKKVGRSAKTGQFVDKQTVCEKPDETIMDIVPTGKHDRNLIDELKTLCDGLNFQSETDRLVEVFVPTARYAKPITAKVMERLTSRKFNGPTPQDHYTFDGFMDKHSRPIVQPQAARYKDLKAWMVENLIERQVFRMTGEIGVFNLTYYVVGLDRNGNLLGFMAEGTET